jgi:hypothetical protein
MSTISLTSVAPQPLSTSPTVATNAKSAFWQKYLSERNPEVQQLKDALQSGDLAAAQQDYNNLVALGNKVLHKDNPFLRSDRALDFNAIGGALQNGDLDGARKAFAALENTYKLPPAANPSSSPTATATASASGVNIIA